MPLFRHRQLHHRPINTAYVKYKDFSQNTSFCSSKCRWSYWVFICIALTVVFRNTWMTENISFSLLAIFFHPSFLEFVGEHLLALPLHDVLTKWDLHGEPIKMWIDCLGSAIMKTIWCNHKTFLACVGTSHYSTHCTNTLKKKKQCKINVIHTHSDRTSMGLCSNRSANKSLIGFGSG